MAVTFGDRRQAKYAQHADGYASSFDFAIRIGAVTTMLAWQMLH